MDNIRPNPEVKVNPNGKKKDDVPDWLQDPINGEQSNDQPVDPNAPPKWLQEEVDPTEGMPKWLTADSDVETNESKLGVSGKPEWMETEADRMPPLDRNKLDQMVEESRTAARRSRMEAPPFQLPVEQPAEQDQVTEEEPKKDFYEIMGEYLDLADSGDSVAAENMWAKIMQEYVAKMSEKEAKRAYMDLALEPNHKSDALDLWHYYQNLPK